MDELLKAAEQALEALMACRRTLWAYQSNGFAPHKFVGNISLDKVEALIVDAADMVRAALATPAATGAGEKRLIAERDEALRMKIDADEQWEIQKRKVEAAEQQTLEQRHRAQDAEAATMAAEQQVAELRDELAARTHERDVHAKAAFAAEAECERLRAIIKYALEDEPNGIPRASSSCREYIRRQFLDRQPE